MKSSHASQLLQEVLGSLGFKSLQMGQDYWTTGPLALGLEFKELKPPFGVGLIVTKSGLDLATLIENQGLPTSVYLWDLSGEQGFSFGFKEFDFKVMVTEQAAADIPELRLHLALLTLLELHGTELRQVVRRYLSYGLSLERAFIDYFGWGPDWKERLLRLSNPSSREEVLRATS